MNGEARMGHKAIAGTVLLALCLWGGLVPVRGDTVCNPPVVSLEAGPDHTLCYCATICCTATNQVTWSPPNDPCHLDAVTSPTGVVSVSPTAWPCSATQPLALVITPLGPGTTTVTVRYWSSGLPGGDVILASDSFYVTVIKVDSVEWVGVDPGDGETNLSSDNPAAQGGGSRIFVEKNTPTGQLHNKVKAVATISPTVPAGGSIDIYFKIFDVDDPTANGTGLTVDDNDTATMYVGGDNRPSGALGVSPSGIITKTITGGNNTAEVEFTLSNANPGNNYKVYADCSLDRIQHVEVHREVENGKDSVNSFVVRTDPFTPIGTGTEKPPADNASPLLSVWRTCHIEMDSMEAPTGNEITGDITRMVESVFSAGKVKRVYVSVSLDDGSSNLDDSPSGNGRFEDGTIEIGSGSAVSTTSSLDGNGDGYVDKDPFSAINGTVAKGGSSVNITVFELSASGQYGVQSPNPGDIDSSFDGGTLTVAGHAMTIDVVSGYSSGSQIAYLTINGSPNVPFRLIDDDATSAPTSVSVVDVVNDRFADAYVKCVVDGTGDAANNNNDIDFVLNVAETSSGVSDILDPAKPGVLDALANRSSSYWGCYVLVGFQSYAAPYNTGTPSEPDYRADGDPYSEAGGDGSSADSPATMGGVWSGYRRAILMLEEDLRECASATSLDFTPFVERVLTHELGHAFDAEHTQGGIMDNAGDTDARFEDKSLDAIRDTVSSP